jgi:Mg/Co/Ni transporter MgtE
MKLFKTLFFVFLLSTTTNVLGKSREYYEQTVIHILTESNSSHQKQVFEQEIKHLFYEIFEHISEKIKIELLEGKGKEDKFI